MSGAGKQIKPAWISAVASTGELAESLKRDESSEGLWSTSLSSVAPTASNSARLKKHTQLTCVFSKRILANVWFLLVFFGFFLEQQYHSFTLKLYIDFCKK